MKKKLLLLHLLTAAFFATAQNVGIGTTTPLARLHVKDSSVLFSATGDVPGSPGYPPIQGAGRRMMWYPDKAAFRAGYVTGALWDKDYIGAYSVAMGIDNLAFGSYSTAMGAATYASGAASTAMGFGSAAIGDYSTAMGESTTAKSAYETVLGRFNTDYTPASTTGWNLADRLFSIGNGTSVSSRSDAMVILKNGNTGIGTSTPQTKLHVANGSSGATPFVFSRLAVESNGDTYINLLSPAPNETAILFGQPGSAANGVIMYNTSGTSNGFQFRNNGNLTRMVIDNAGNVGIGTTTPAFPLSFGNALGDKISLWSNTSNSYGFGILSGLLQIHTDVSDADIAFGYGSSAALTERMRIKGNGNVGIGTTIPQARLHVSDSSVLFSATVDIPVTAGLPPIQGNGRRMMWYPDKAAFRVGYVEGANWNKDSIGNYSFACGYNTKAIGFKSTAMGESAAATGPFSTAIGYQTIASGDVSTAMGLQTIASGLVSTAMGIKTTAKSGYETVIGRWNTDYTPASTTGWNITDRLFSIGNGPDAFSRSDAMVVLKNGNTGIGISDPSATIEVIRGTGVNGTAVFRGTTHMSHFNYGSTEDTYIRGGKDNSSVIINDITGGKVGIGTTSPSEKLHVAGNICYTGSIAACSDIRYKKDFSSINNSLSSVLSLNGIYYFWKKDVYPDMQFTVNRQIGFSAQEIEKLFPEVVLTDARGYKSVDYGRLTPVLVEAIKEQQQQIDKQQQQIDELKKMVEKLLKQLLHD